LAVFSEFASLSLWSPKVNFWLLLEYCYRPDALHVAQSTATQQRRIQLKTNTVGVGSLVPLWTLMCGLSGILPELFIGCL